MMFVLVKHIREFPFETIYSVNGQECGIAVSRSEKKQTTSDDPWCEANALDCFLIFWSPFVSRQKVKSLSTQLGKMNSSIPQCTVFTVHRQPSKTLQEHFEPFHYISCEA